MDSTEDMTKLDLVSFIFRYIVVNYDEHTIDVKESFLRFYKLTKDCAEDHVNLIYDVLNKFNLDIKKISWTRLRRCCSYEWCILWYSETHIQYSSQCFICPLHSS